MADNQNESKLIYFLVLQSYAGPGHPLPEASLVTSFIIYIGVFTGKKLDGKRTLFRQSDHHFYPNITINTPIQFGFIPCVMMGTNPPRKKPQLAMYRTTTFALIQLTWNVTDFSDEASDVLPISSLLKGHISFLFAYITSFTSNLKHRLWGTQTPLFCYFYFHFTPVYRRWFRAANHYNCICYCCIFLLLQSWFQHFLMAQGITFYWPTKKHPAIHFHLPYIDLSQAWQSFKIKHFTVCQSNLKHTTRKNCFVHKWTHERLEKP